MDQVHIIGKESVMGFTGFELINETVPCNTEGECRRRKLENYVSREDSVGKTV
jgi:hypothetical protein